MAKPPRRRNKRAKPKPVKFYATSGNNFDKVTQQQIDKAVATMVNGEYACFVGVSVFQSHYLPMIKLCNAERFIDVFNERLKDLVDGLDVLSSEYRTRKWYINKFALAQSFNYTRKLCITIENVCLKKRDVESGQESVLEKGLTETGIEVRLHFLSCDTSQNDVTLSTYECKTAIKIQEGFQLFLEVPVSSVVVGFN